MSTKLKGKKTSEMPGTFQELVLRLMPRKIHDQAELAAAQEMIDGLAILPKLTHDQLDYLETLADLVVAYETHAVKISRRSGLDTLRFLLRENNLNATALSRILGTDTSLGYRILAGERNLTLNHARKLAQHFRVTYEVFLV